MAFVHGKNAHLTYGTINLSPYLNNVDLPRGVNPSETTTFGQGATTYITGLIDSTMTAAGLFDPTVAAALDAYVGGTAQTFVYGPGGTASGAYKLSGTAVLTQAQVTSAVADAVSLSLSWQVSGTVTAGTF